MFLEKFSNCLNENQPERFKRNVKTISRHEKLIHRVFNRVRCLDLAKFASRECRLVWTELSSRERVASPTNTQPRAQRSGTLRPSPLGSQAQTYAHSKIVRAHHFWQQDQNTHTKCSLKNSPSCGKMTKDFLCEKIRDLRLWGSFTSQVHLEQALSDGVLRTMASLDSVISTDSVDITSLGEQCHTRVV